MAIPQIGLAARYSVELTQAKFISLQVLQQLT
jgi:hypothetical protein